MLLYFKTSNNRSFQEGIEFSMIASTHKDLQGHLITIEKYKINLLKSSVIYGANASGKSNLVRGILDGCQLVISSFRPDSEKESVRFPYNKNDPGNEKGVTSYHYGILIEGIHYDYFFSVNATRIMEEELREYNSQKPITHFSRKFNLLTGKYDWKPFSKFYVGERESMKNIAESNHKSLYLSICNEGKLPIAEKVFQWFKIKILGTSSSDMGTILNQTLSLINADLNVRKLLLKELSDSDFLIRDLKLEQIGTDIKKQMFNVLTYHNTIKGKETGFNLYTEESKGTTALLGWLGVWYLALNYGFVLIIDELENSMHPLLVKYLINKFNDSKQNKAQLIFTTHNTTLMSPDIFRRDQIWIVDRDRQGNSTLNPVSDYKVRKGHIIENSYLQGLYGGIPHIIE